MVSSDLKGDVPGTPPSVGSVQDQEASATLSLDELWELFSFSSDYDKLWELADGFDGPLRVSEVTIGMSADELARFESFRSKPFSYDIKAPRGVVWHLKEFFRNNPGWKWAVTIFACIPPMLIALPFVLYTTLCVLQSTVDEDYDLGAALAAAFIPKEQSPEEAYDAAIRKAVEAASDGDQEAFDAALEEASRYIPSEEPSEPARAARASNAKGSTSTGASDAAIATMEPAGDIAYIISVFDADWGEYRPYIVVPVRATFEAGVHPFIEMRLRTNDRRDEGIHASFELDTYSLSADMDMTDHRVLADILFDSQYGDRAGAQWLLYPFHGPSDFWEPQINLEIFDSSGDLAKSFTYQPRLMSLGDLDALAERELAGAGQLTDGGSEG